MRIVQINGAAKSGSTGKIVSQLSEVMTQRGIENYIITSGYKEEDSRENVYTVSNNIEVKIHQLCAYMFGDAGFHSAMATRRIIKILEKVHPSVVHLHHIYGYWLNVEMLLTYLKNKRIKVLWTIHDFWAITGHCTHFEAINCEKWKTGCYDCVQKKDYPYSLFFDRSAELYKKKKAIIDNWTDLEIVCVSQWVSNILLDSFMGNKRMTVIPNGVDLSIFHPQRIEDATFEGQYVILGVAMSWSEKKGLDDFIKMSRLLQSDEVIVLVGLSDTQRENLPHNIIGLPRTGSPKELCKLYNVADVYVSASVEETMGLTVAEALACGTPAIVYQDTALTELITDQTGMVSSQNIEELYNAVREIRKNGKAKYHNSCVEFVKTKYEKWKQYNKYCDYYYEMLGEQL